MFVNQLFAAGLNSANKLTFNEKVLIAGKTAAVSVTTIICYKLTKHVWQNRILIAERLRSTLSVNNYTRLVEFCSSDIQQDQRQLFKDNCIETLIEHSMPRNHTHAQAAIYRCRANTTISALATKMGLTLYSVSTSKTEEKVGVQGSRQYYNVKDLAMQRKNDKILSHHLIKMTDVDYYVNMKDYLVGNYLIIYTFLPQGVAGATTDGVYRVLEDNTVDVHINGGGHYNHELWDYETDHLIIDHWWGSSVYLVEQRSISDDRRLIFFNPIRNIYGPFAWVYPGKRLTRRRFVWDNMAYCKYVFNKDGINRVNHSFAILDDNTCATLEDRLMVSVRGRLMHTSRPTMSDIERILRADQVQEAAVFSAILFQVTQNPYLAYHVFTKAHYPITKVPEGDSSYMPIGNLVHEDGVDSMRTVGPRYLDDAVHPKRGENSDQSCLQGRIYDVKNRVDKYPPFYLSCLDEFVNYLVPQDVAHTLVPEDFDYMYKAWERPAQRRKLDAIKHLLFLDKPWAVKSFQKAESYAKITHPRNISTLPTDHNVRLGQYSMSLTANVFKKAHWYAFGRTPQMISQVLHEKCRPSRFAVPTDVSRMDGSCGKIHQLLIDSIILRAFAPCYHEEIKRLMALEAKAKGFTKFGIFYRALFNTLSGSSDTSWRNSAINAFLNYLALRISGLSSEEAWNSLGIFGGDDGVSFDIDPDLLQKVFAKTGMLLKSEVIQSGQPVPFLGRYYIDPWTLPDNIADVPRQLRKAHLSATPKSVPDFIVLRRKAEGVLTTDPMTPIISNWARAILRVTNSDPTMESKYASLTARDLSYWARFENPFPASLDQQLVMDVVAQQFGGHLNVLMWCDKFDRVQNFEQLDLGLLLNKGVTVEIPAVYQGQVVVPMKPMVQPQEKLKSILKKSAPRNLVIKPPSGQQVVGFNVACRNKIKFGKCTRLGCKFIH